MKYLHVRQHNNELIIHWANEIPDDESDNPMYIIPTYKVHKIGTEQYYDEAIDYPNEYRIEKGLQPFYYEVTDIEVEKQEEEILAE